VAAMGKQGDFGSQSLELEFSNRSLPGVLRLARISRQHAGLPLRSHVHSSERLEIEAARELLASGELVTVVANELAFSSSQYFATVFRRYTQTSPPECRGTPGERDEE
jgi:AraC-like DNA-binding protein